MSKRLTYLPFAAGLLVAALATGCAGTAERPSSGPARVAAPVPAISTRVDIVPQAGQDAGRVDRDRYECHVAAVKQSRFDPSERAPMRDEAVNYRRAAVACFEARNYSVK